MGRSKNTGLSSYFDIACVEIIMDLIMIVAPMLYVKAKNSLFPHMLFSFLNR